MNQPEQYERLKPASCPSVSIVLPAYNASQYVEEAMRAMLTQTWTDFELLVLEDGSTDNTFEIVERLAREDDRIRVIKNEQNLGLSQRSTADWLLPGANTSRAWTLMITARLSVLQFRSRSSINTRT